MNPLNVFASPNVTHRRNSIRRLRAWAVFRRACGNEMAFDAALMESLGLSPLLPSVIPRPIPVMRKLSHLRPIWPLLFTVAAGAWAWIIFPAFLCFQVLRTIRLWQRVPRRTATIAEDLGVVLSGRVNEVMRCVLVDRRPRQWITVPWICANIPDADGESVSLLSYAHWTDFLRVAWSAYQVVHIVRRKGLGRWPGGSCRTAILQTFVAWDWLLTWELLPRCLTPQTGLWFANHYDRWAVLIDQIPEGGPRYLIQHGFARGGVTLPHQLQNVKEVLFFDQQTRQILQDVALAARCRPKWTPLLAQLKLTSWPQRNGKREVVLVIGQPVEPELERKLLAALTTAFPHALLLYKAHPLYGRSGASHVSSPPVEILWTRDVYPEADIVLSGSSWLGVEYESTGVPVVWYKSRSLVEVVDQTARHLNRVARTGATPADQESQAAA